MKKKITQFILGVFTIILFSKITVVFFSMIKPDISSPYIIFFIGALLTIIFAFFFKKKKVFFYTSIITSLLTICLLTYEKHMENSLNEGHSVKWKTKIHSTTIPFFISETNLIFIKAKINNESKYLLFDTGASLPSFKEKHNNDKELPTYMSINTTDGNGISKKLKIQELNNLSIGNLNFKNVKNFPFITKGFDTNKIIKENSIAGLFSSNLMKDFIWDFNMKNQNITITDKLVLEKNIEMVTVPLIEYNNRWKIAININGLNREAIFDTGATSILNIKDTLKLPRNYNYLIKYTSSGSAYSDEKPNDIVIKRKIFVDVSLSDIIFKDICVTDRSNNNLIGNPLMWEYERVILDFTDKKMYLIHKNNSLETESISNISERSRLKLTKEPAPNNMYY